MLEVEGLTVRYGGVTAVRGLDLRCRPGEVVALVGPNGAGKSSSLLAIAGALARSQTSGSVRLDGRELGAVPAERVVRHGIALVPEGRHIFAQLSVRENLMLGATVAADRRAVASDAAALCTRFPVLGDRIDDPAGLLSGGEQQQLAIARALMSRPSFLLLDEPSLGLAPQMVDLVLDLVDELRADGLGVILVDQNVERSIALADHSILLRQGVVEAAGAEHDTAAILAHYFGAETP